MKEFFWWIVGILVAAMIAMSGLLYVVDDLAMMLLP